MYAIDICKAQVLETYVVLIQYTSGVSSLNELTIAAMEDEIEQASRPSTVDFAGHVLPGASRRRDAARPGLGRARPAGRGRPRRGGGGTRHGRDVGTAPGTRPAGEASGLRWGTAMAAWSAGAGGERRAGAVGGRPRA